jgi:subtilase family serine protease
MGNQTARRDSQGMARTIGLNRVATAIALAVFVGGIVPAKAADERVRARVDGNITVVVPNSLHPRAIAENDRGPVDPTLVLSEITLNIKLSAKQQNELDQLLEEQRDPSSAAFQKWLTPEEYGNRFGLGHADMEKLTAWLLSQGFSVDHVSRSMNWVSFSGTASQVDQTFHTALHRFVVDGEMHFANTAQPSIPAAFSDIIAGFQGITDFRLKPQRLKTRAVNPDYTAAGGGHNLAPGDLAAIYNISPLYSSGIDGTGEKLVVAGQTDVAISDIQAFRSQFGLSANTPQMVLYGTDPGTVSGDMEEADLDLEWSGSVARNATIIYVYSRNVINSVQYAISQNLAPVITLSYGGCEAENSSTLRSVAQQANAQGITWLASSGDSGAAGCDQGNTATHGLAVNMPASIPEVTAVGGSEFMEGSGSYWSTANGANGGSAVSYIPEMAWNDSVARGDLSATGGGASIFYSKPAWQTGPGVPNDGARDVPDVSLPASPDHDGYYFYAGGKMSVVGGTSVSTPAFAGIVTLLNQYLVTNGIQVKPGLGNINPTLYHLAAGANTAFHDITAGNNVVPCAAASPNCVNGSLGFTAGPGYDEVTGLGSVNANNLVMEWASLPSSISTTLTLAAAPTSVAPTGSTVLTATVKAATGASLPTGSVTFSRGTTTLGTVALAGATGTLTVSASSLSSGGNTLSATYAGNATFNGSTNSAFVTVTGTTNVGTTSTLVANPSSIAATGSTLMIVTVTPSIGTKTPTGTATFSLGSTTLGAAGLSASGSNGVASFTLSGSKLASGRNTVTVTYGGGAGFTGSSATAIVTLTVPAGPVTTTTSVSANPATIAATATTILTATVKSAGGSTPPTGTVTFTLGTTTLGTGTLATTASGATAGLTVKGSQLAAGLNMIKATYNGSTAFGASSSTVTVTVGSSANSSITATITPNPVLQQHRAWVFTIQLLNGGGASTLTNFTVNGASYASAIPVFFGTSNIAANAKLATTLQMTNVPVPTSIVFGFSGTDLSGATWTQSVTVPFQ